MVNKMYEIAIVAPLYTKIVYGNRNFLVLKYNDNLKPGNMICLREFDGENYTSRFKAMGIKHVVMGDNVEGVIPGYCIISW